MIPNTKLQEAVAILDNVAPISQGAGSVTSGWVSMANFHRIAAIIQTGVLGASATLDAKLQQATDSSGTGVKDITGKALVQIVKATGDGKQAMLEVADAELDTANGFSYVRLSMTVGTAASLVSAIVLGFNARFMPASVLNNATAVQLVG